MSYFSNHRKDINFYSAEPERGLRNAQIGALFSIGSYFSLKNTEPALISMPTGSGKTAVLTIAAFMLRAERVLIITPSVLVRGQIAKEISTLKTVKELNCLNGVEEYPKVKELKKLLTDINEYDQFQEYDVIISTPNSFHSVLETNPSNDIFDLILVDEAHHVPAKTWTDILMYYKDVRQILFTATPFRKDKKEIKGEIIYNYPLSQAYDDKIFGEVEFHPVTKSFSTDDDITLALRAEKLFKQDREKNYKHFLMARTKSKKEAKALINIYSEYTSLRMQKIDSSNSLRFTNGILKKLRNDELDGIICVDMLGEGFDFPNLKIAVIHSPHKSLSVILQFIGRFARTNSSEIGTAKFLAIENDELMIENTKLFQSNSVWNDIIIDLSEKRIFIEKEVKEYFKNFSPLSVDKEITKEESFSYYNVSPYFHVKVYKTKDFIINDEVELEGQEIVKYSKSDDNTTAIIISRKLNKPKWLNNNDLENIKYYLYLIYYDVENEILFLNSQEKNDSRYEELIENFTITEPEKIPKNKIHKVLADLEHVEIFNVGLANKFQGSGETYRIMAGSNTEKVINPSSGKMFANGHIFCKANEKDSEITVGYSSASKIWSNKYAKISDFVNWCKTIANKIESNKVVKTNTNFDLLPIGEKMVAFPKDIFTCDFNKEIYLNLPIIKLEGTEENLFDIEFNIVSQTTEVIEVEVTLADVKMNLIYKLDCTFEHIDNGNSERILFLDGDEYLDIVDYMNIYPLTFYTVNNSAIIDNELFRNNTEEVSVFDKQKVIGIAWDEYNTDTQNEITGENSIHQVMKNMLVAKKYEVIIYDHGTGELADFITIMNKDTMIEIELYHVKGAGGTNFNNRVNDLYEVCGQSVKCLKWIKSNVFFMKNIIRRTKEDDAKYLLGNLEKTLQMFSEKKQIRYKIILVQPGISKSVEIPSKLAEVLAAADFYVLNEGNVNEFVVWGSN